MIRIAGVCLMVLSVLARPEPILAQGPRHERVPPNASEVFIIREINRIRESTEIHRTLRPIYMLDYCDALLERFPDSNFREEALILKLTALSGLARTRPGYLQELLTLTEEIARQNPEGRLASENAYYSIQAFVLGARFEDMPEERRILGTRERYEAFLADYPESSRAPTIAASLVRLLLSANEIEKAEKWIERLRREHPDDPGTRRAEGELQRVKAVGRAFRFEHATPDGETLRTADYAGKVLVIHFWASWSEDAVKAFPELIRLHQEFKDQGLQLISINVDRKRKWADQTLEKYKASWPQLFDDRGFGSDILIKTGVVQIPTYFVIDRDGVLRSTDPGSKLHELVKELIAKPVKGKPKESASKKKEEAPQQKATP
jgi:thiol-disulfide isomerase/thioredoxin